LEIEVRQLDEGEPYSHDPLGDRPVEVAAAEPPSSLPTSNAVSPAATAAAAPPDEPPGVRSHEFAADAVPQAPLKMGLAWENVRPIAN
jgi:hypothetical protein